MKKVFVVIGALMACIILSCNQNSTETKKATDSTAVTTLAKPAISPALSPALPPATRTFITIDTANIMLASYLNSIHFQNSDSCMKSVYFNADSLRAYLNDTTHGKIAMVRVMFAHNIPYIIGGGRNKYAGVNKTAFTAIIVGMDANYNYVYNINNMIMDHAMPCPTSCPTIGTGASDMLPVVAH